MHDIKFIRDNPEAFDKGLAERGLDNASDELLALDAEVRKWKTRLQANLEKRNALSKEIGEAKKQKRDTDQLMAEVNALKEEIAGDEKGLAGLEKKLEERLAGLPNLPAADVPQGVTEACNAERYRVGEPRKFVGPRQHFEIGEALGLMDFETAAKISGARFVVLKGALAQLERALGTFMLDLHTKEHGYTEVSPPLLVRDQTMYGTAQLPKFHDDQFAAFPEPVMRSLFFKDLQEDRERTISYVEKNGLEAAKKRNQIDPARIKLSYSPDRFWLIPTSEVPLTNFVRESIQDEKSLPLRYTAFTPCFRAEAGAAGKDTRGMIRQHQFSKVELVSVTTPEQSEAEHERMLKSAEEVLKRLELPFRTMTLCAGDMGFAAKKTYDIEVWLPGQDAYREISSCSNCGDFQARRMNARFKSASKGNVYVHTLNGSGVAVGRCLIAILENYQNKDGSVSIPKALQPYMGGMTEIRKS